MFESPLFLSLGIMLLKFFHGLPLGSLMKNLTISMHRLLSSAAAF
jgi:hypothetical protein